MIKTGERFTVENDGATYSYEFLYLDPKDAGHEVVLWSLDHKRELRVDPGWLRRQKISKETGGIQC